MKATLTGMLIAGLFLAAAAVAAPAPTTIISLDDPNAGTAARQGTAAVAINTAGTITGGYIDRNNVGHGFVRSASGVYTTFNAPGGVKATVGWSINTAGVITGFDIDASSATHGFVRSTTGTITTFSAPGAGTGSGQGTFGYGINTSGAISGTYIDSTGVHHGFVRATNGTITMAIIRERWLVLSTRRE
jgi:hypothetical protein